MPSLPARRLPRRRGSSIAAAVTLLVVGCGDDDASDACGPITREALDPAYLVHVLGTETDVDYTSDPPTSGPHQPAPPVDEVSAEPVTRPVQVGILERGDVLLQHDPALDADERARLEDLAGDGVFVAPNPELPEPIVATAWLYKRTCDAADADALQEFIDERRGKGPEG
jgi:Asp-tRNA(Asn)/Glu-tRNA(Gln) amidotransferase A subunit family amidase